MTWLKGGPFLEVSFILKAKEGRIQMLLSIINALKHLPYSINVMSPNIEELIIEFDNGYYFDETDLNSKIIHSISLGLYICIAGKRKSKLYVEQVSEETILLNFCFYGSVFDADEWEQIGVKETDYIKFDGFLKSLKELDGFIVGGIAIEDDVLSLYQYEGTWPDKEYNYKRLSPFTVKRNLYQFRTILWNTSLYEGGRK